MKFDRTIVISCIFSLAISIVFLLLVFGKPNAWHLVAYQIHLHFLDENLIGEAQFIDTFDVVVSVLVFFCFFKFLKRKLEK